MRVELTWRYEGLAQHTLYAFFRYFTGQQGVERGAQGVDIRARIGVTLSILLGSRITRRDSLGALGRSGFGIIDLGNAKINQHRLIIWGNADIGRLDVAVNDRWVLAVQIGEGIAHLIDPAQCLCLGKVPT